MESSFSYPFKEEIAEDGKNYKLNKIDYSVLNKTEQTKTVHQTVTSTIEDLYEKSFDISDPSTLNEIKSHASS